MREILFRGKRQDTCEWVFGLPFYGLDEEIDGIEAGVSCKELYAIVPETLGQFTGRMDKHGKRVFEEDILQLYTVWDGRSEPAGCPVVVRWCENDQCYVLTLKDENHHVADFGNYGRPEYYEVIGNIHDNPELLDGGVGNEV